MAGRRSRTASWAGRLSWLKLGRQVVLDVALICGLKVADGVKRQELELGRVGGPPQLEG